MLKFTTIYKNLSSKIKPLALILGFILGLSTVSAQYCSSNATSTADEDIVSVYLPGNTVTLNNVSAAPTCQTYTDWTSLTPVDLSAGRSYTITVTESTCNGHYTYRCLAWIDYNRNNVFESGEAVANTSQTGSGAGFVFKYTWTVPCNIVPGNTRMRVVMIEGAMNNPGSACGTYTWGETEDYTVNLQLPTSVSANFVAPSDAWVKAVVKFINNNQTGYISHSWDANNDGSIENPNTVNFNYTWATPGQKCVKLKSTNCLGSDSIVKCLNLNSPTAIPVVDFVADKVVIEQYEDVQIFDLSTNGPWEWTWDVYDSTTYASSGYYPNLTDGDLYADPYGLGNTEYSQNPQFAFDVPGCYTIVLTCKNDVGPSVPKRKICYVTVTLPTQYNLGYGTYGPNNDNVVGSPGGTIFDDGGPNLNYGSGQGLGTRSYLQITPCNAKKIVLTMSRLKFKDNADVLRVWDGKTPGGPGTTLLATWSLGSKAPATLTATSGSMYILFESDGSGVDSGFAGSYSSELGPASIATPSFTPNTVPSYNATPVLFTNTTTGVVGVPTWEWTIDDNQVANNTRKDFRYTFTTDGQYKVCLEIKSCVGNNKSCTMIDVETANKTTQLDFNTSNRRPNVNVDLTALKPVSDNANRFEWTIFPTSYTLINPPSSPSSYGAGFIKYNATPGDSIPTPIIKLNAAGCYTISLKAYNSLDPTNTTRTIVKNKYICGLDYCKPSSYILSSDVGINRVKVADGTNELINNYTTSGDKSYSDFSLDQVANLTYGKTYTLTVERNSSVDPANRKAWIDWNIDGDFDDANEMIFFESSTYNKTYTTTFTVPALAQSFEGLTKMRIAINYNNEITTACGPITAGEYEDYGLMLANDNMRPVITLSSNDTVRIEVGSTYTDAGATAFDQSEGDISGEMTLTSDLETNTAGVYSVEYNVTDKSGNKAEPGIRTVIVVNDLTMPILTLNPGSNVCIEADRNNPPYVDPGATASDNKFPFTLTSAIVTEGTVDSRVAGNYQIKYTVQDLAGNKVSKVRFVCVEDSKAPVIDTLGDAKIQINSVWFDQTVAVDAYDDQPVLIKDWGFNGPVNTILKRTYSVVYTAIDATGNVSAPVSRNYKVDDYIPPVIHLNTFDIVRHKVRTPYISVKPSVTDNYYPQGEVSLVMVGSNIDLNTIGTYTEVFEAIDGSGNVSRKTRTIIVEDTEAPRIWADVIHGCVGENIWPMWGISTADNYYSPSQLKPLVEIVSQNVNIWEEGVYYITYRVTDPSGNTSEEFDRMVYFTFWPKCYNSTVSVNTKNLDEKVEVYPNPSSGMITIDLNGLLTEGISIEVYNAMGQQVLLKNHEGVSGKFEIDLSGNAAGVYTIRLIADGQTITKRVVLQ